MPQELLHIDGVGSVSYEYFTPAQSFTPDEDWVIETVWFGGLWYSPGGGFGSATLRLFSDDGGEPGSQIGSNSGAELVASFASPGVPITFTFGTPISVKAGVTYWFVIVQAGGGGVGTGFQRTAASVYSGGMIGFSVDGNTWTIDDYDVDQMKINGIIGTENPEYSVMPRIIGPGRLETVMADTETFLESMDDGRYVIDSVDMQHLGDDWFRGVVMARGVDVITNGDNEAALADSTLLPRSFNRAVITQSLDFSRSGANSLKVVCNGGGNGYVRWRIGNPGGTPGIRGWNYRFTCWAYCDGVQDFGVLRLVVDVYDFNQQVVGFAQSLLRDKWVKYDYTLWVPEDASDIEFMMNAQSPTAGATFYLDDISIKYS